MMVQKSGLYIRMVSTLSGVTLVFEVCHS